jgi:hypothetical protein
MLVSECHSAEYFRLHESIIHVIYLSISESLIFDFVFPDELKY